MNTRQIKTKRPFRRVRPDGYMRNGSFPASFDAEMPIDNVGFQIVTQADFLREYYPSGHAINDHTFYPDIYREEIVDVLDAEGNPTDKKTKRLYKEPVPRYAFAFQQVITVKQLVHLCGNDIQFEINKTDVSDEETDMFNILREGWLDKDMEIAFYEAAKSVKITGDAAFVGYLENGVFGWKVLSFLNGDVLYPHYDKTGKLSVFARSSCNYDETGTMTTEWLEVWDDKYLYRFKKGKGKRSTEIIKDIFSVDGYALVSKDAHGFPSIPVSYKRDEDGACWSPSQDTIEGYELSFSQMAHNNQAYGEPMLIFQGEGENLDILKDVNGTIKSLTMGTDDKASYLQSQSASDSYLKQLETQLDMIYFQSFIVKPPELKSGDLPAAALKILYSPSYEKAMTDSKEFQTFLNGMVDIFRYGYGIEKERTIGFTNLPLKWWIEPYVHVNSSTVIADLASAVQNGFCSRQTASERIETLYTSNSEWDRIMKEQKEQREQEILAELRKQNSQQQTEEEG